MASNIFSCKYSLFAFLCFIKTRCLINAKNFLIKCHLSSKYLLMNLVPDYINLVMVDFLLMRLLIIRTYFHFCIHIDNCIIVNFCKTFSCIFLWDIKYDFNFIHFWFFSCLVSWLKGWWPKNIFPFFDLILNFRILYLLYVLIKY